MTASRSARQRKAVAEAGPLATVKIDVDGQQQFVYKIGCSVCVVKDRAAWSAYRPGADNGFMAAMDRWIFHLTEKHPGPTPRAWPSCRPPSSACTSGASSWPPTRRRSGCPSGGGSAGLGVDVAAQQLVGPVAPGPERGLAATAHRDDRAQDGMAGAVVVGPGARTPDEERPAVARLELDVAHATRSSRNGLPSRQQASCWRAISLSSKVPRPLRSRRPRRRRVVAQVGTQHVDDGDLLVDRVGLDVLVEVGDRVLGTRAAGPRRRSACWAGSWWTRTARDDRRCRPAIGADRACHQVVEGEHGDGYGVQVRPVGRVQAASAWSRRTAGCAAGRDDRRRTRRTGSPPAPSWRHRRGEGSPTSAGRPP